MSYYLIQQIGEIENITVRTCTEVIGASGDGHLEQLTLRNTADGGTEIVDAQMLFVFIGAAPLTDWLDGVVVRDDHGFVVAGPDLSVGGQKPPGWQLDRAPYHLETSVPGVFVAGDVRAESAKRVASAVGEGAMAVMLVHRYLEKLSYERRASHPAAADPIAGSPAERPADAAVRRRRAAHPVPVREAERRAAGLAVPGRAGGAVRARAGVRRG